MGEVNLAAFGRLSQSPQYLPPRQTPPFAHLRGAPRSAAPNAAGGGFRRPQTQFCLKGITARRALLPQKSFPTPKRSFPPSGRLLREPRRRFAPQIGLSRPLVGDRGGFPNPRNISHPDKRRHSHTCAALRVRLRRTRQAAALAAALKRSSAFQAELRAAPSFTQKIPRGVTRKGSF